MANRATLSTFCCLILSSVCNGAIFENVSLFLKWHSHMEDAKPVRIVSDDQLRFYVGEFGEVIIENQNIPKLEKLSVSNLPKTTHVHLVNCSIRKIEAGSFQNLPALTDLNLSDNLLEEIQDGVLDNLGFKSLYLEGNRIATIGERAFNNLQMEYLFIDNNRISEWKSDWFRGTPLVSISIANNHLQALPRLAFEYLWHFGKDVVVINFTVSRNKLNYIDVDAFKGVKMIVTLNLQNNSLTHLQPGMFDSVENVDQIDLSYNELSRIYYEVFRKTKVSHLNVAENLLSCVCPDIFNTTELRTVHVEGNPISCECLETWSKWKHKSRLPEIGFEMDRRCTSAATGLTHVYTLLLVLFSLQ